MQQIKGISDKIVDDLVNRATELGQGRTAGTVGFIDNDNIISTRIKIIDGGNSGIPYRQLLSQFPGEKNRPLLEMINRLPDNSVMISIKPGKTGLIVSTGGINIFNLPIVKIGVKCGEKAGVGLQYPEKEFFRLASRSEKIQLKVLSAFTMEEEREALRNSSRLHLEYLQISRELPVVTGADKKVEVKPVAGKARKIKSKYKIREIDEKFARILVEKSLAVEQGREVAAIGKVDQKGVIRQAGSLIVGGMGYIPSRLLASSYQDISDLSLREVYSQVIPPDCVIVHTHPGGTGVMHISDAMAGPGTWGLAIAAIGHTESGEIKGVNVITPSSRLFQLADENEQLEQEFFKINTSEEEVKLRKRRYQIAQEFTDLCQEIELSGGC